jgi:hypothetical protein
MVDPRSRYRQVIDQMDAGRRMTTTLLQRCDVGVPVEVALRELAPSLSPAAADAARKLVELTAFHFTATALVLSGLAPPEVLEDIPEPPARPTRRTPDEIVAEWLLPVDPNPSSTEGAP